MAIRVDVSAPTNAFTLEWKLVFEAHPSARVEFQPYIPLDGEFLPLMWVYHEEAAEIEATLRDLSGIDSITRFRETAEATLFEVSWTAEAGSLHDGIQTMECYLVEAVGTADEWTLQVYFHERDELVNFNQFFLDHGIPLTITRIEEANLSPDPEFLSREQRQAVNLAHRHGYFEVPRECTLGDLAEEAGISTSAFSERLRRGLAVLTKRMEPTSPSPDR